MKISVLQLGVIPGDRAANKENAALRIRQAVEFCPDVLVLPEFWDVGYPPHVEKLGDPDGREAREFLSTQARAYGVNIVGGAVVREQDGKLWNTAYVFDRQGACLAAYDKIHLFSFGGEPDLFQAGETPSRYVLDGVPVGSLTCYDLRFGELARTLALNGANILFVPAMWGKCRLEHWRLLLRTRAVENQMFVVGASLAETPESLLSCGHSMIVDPWGGVLAEAGPDEMVIQAECNFSRLREIRETINVFRDRRPEVYAWSPPRHGLRKARQPRRKKESPAVPTHASVEIS